MTGNESDDENIFWEKLCNYLFGEVSAIEIEKFENWIEQNPETCKYVKEFFSWWKIKSPSAESVHQTTEAFERHMKRLNP